MGVLASDVHDACHSENTDGSRDKQRRQREIHNPHIHVDLSSVLCTVAALAAQSPQCASRPLQVCVFL